MDQRGHPLDAYSYSGSGSTGNRNETSGRRATRRYNPRSSALITPTTAGPDVSKSVSPFTHPAQHVKSHTHRLQNGPTILTFTLKHRPRATRASAPKVRSGCKTCKSVAPQIGAGSVCRKRHLKCDENTPSCSRCIKWRGFCEGYDDPVPSSTPSLAPPWAAASVSSDTEITHTTTRTTAMTSATVAAGVSTSLSPVGKREKAVVAATHYKALSYVSRVASSQAATATRAPLIEPNFNSVMFANQWEKVYFDNWLNLAPNLGGGWFSSHLWTTTVPQLCRDEPTVRHAAIAVGAMIQSMAATGGGILGRSYRNMLAVTHSSINAAPHYQSALTHYIKALRMLRNMHSAGNSSDLPTQGALPPKNSQSENERAAVMACLLFVCFEALQGNREAALRHIRQGLCIMDQFVARTLPATSALATSMAPERPPLSAVNGEGDSSISGNWPLNGGLSRVLTKSPAPYILEDEVMQMFRRLDYQAWSLGLSHRSRSREADVKFEVLDALNPEAIPAVFADLDDARRWWDLVQHWVLHFPRYMVSALQQFVRDNPHATAADVADVEDADGHCCVVDIRDVPGACAVQQEYLGCLERWRAAFLPLYDATRQQWGHDGSSKNSAVAEADYLRASSLQIQYLLAWTSVKSMVYSDYKVIHALTPYFREITRLSAVLLPRQLQHSWLPFSGIQTGVPLPHAPAPVSSSDAAMPQPVASVGGEIFTMDSGTSIALFVVTCKCRSAEVRREATRLLTAYPRREGFWDTKVLGVIGGLNERIESDNESSGTLYQQWLRLRQREAIFDDNQAGVAVTCYHKNWQTGRFELRTRLLEY